MVFFGLVSIDKESASIKSAIRSMIYLNGTKLAYESLDQGDKVPTLAYCLFTKSIRSWYNDNAM